MGADFYTFGVVGIQVKAKELVTVQEKRVCPENECRYKNPEKGASFCPFCGYSIRPAKHKIIHPALLNIVQRTTDQDELKSNLHYLGSIGDFIMRYTYANTTHILTMRSESLSDNDYRVDDINYVIGIEAFSYMSTENVDYRRINIDDIKSKIDLMSFIQIDLNFFVERKPELHIISRISA